MANIKTITRNGMAVSCYGEWQEDSNCMLIGEYKGGLEMEDIWAGDGWPEDKPWPTNWTQVVEHLTEWAVRNGHEISELEAC